MYALILSSSLLCKSIQSLFNLSGFHYSYVCLTLSACAGEIAHMVVDVGSCQGDQSRSATSRSWRWWTNPWIWRSQSRLRICLTRYLGVQGCGWWQGGDGGWFKILKIQKNCDWLSKLVTISFVLIAKKSTLRSIAKCLRMIILAYFNQQVENLLLVFRSCTKSDWWQSIFEAPAKTLLISMLPGYLWFSWHLSSFSKSSCQHPLKTKVSCQGRSQMSNCKSSLITNNWNWTGS